MESVQIELLGTKYTLAIPADEQHTQGFLRMVSEECQYEIVMAAVLKRLLALEPAPGFVDVGSFVGHYTCFAGMLLQGRAPVWAVESNPTYAEVTAASIEWNGIHDATVYTRALVEAGGTASVSGPQVVSGEAGTDSTRAMSFDDFCSENAVRPDVVKIDVHGAEGRVLAGGGRTLRESVSYVLLELHPNVYLSRFSPGISRNQVLDMLEDCGFHLYYVAGHRYSWSDGLHYFMQTGGFAYRPLTRDNRELLLFDRTNHLFVLACRQPVEAVLGEPVTDPALHDYPEWVRTA